MKCRPHGHLKERPLTLEPMEIVAFKTHAFYIGINLVLGDCCRHTREAALPKFKRGFSFRYCQLSHATWHLSQAIVLRIFCVILITWNYINNNLYATFLSSRITPPLETTHVGSFFWANPHTIGYLTAPNFCWSTRMTLESRTDRLV